MTDDEITRGSGLMAQNAGSASDANGSPDPDRQTRFVELLTAHQRKLYSYICMLLLGDRVAADILQETNLDLWARSSEFDFERPFLPWAFGFARQRVRAYRKKQSRSRLIFGEEILDRFEEACMTFADESDARLIALRSCLKKLNERQAILIRERYMSKTSVQSIAAQMGESAHNVSCQLHRIRKLLARCVETALAVEER